jgi:hypothetical protein
MHRNSTKDSCPVKVNCNPLKSLLYLACGAFFVRDDLNLESNMKTCTGNPLKTAFCIQLQINNSKGWYQNVLFGGGVLKPRYNSAVVLKVTDVNAHQGRL